ncbi:MAG: M56 family metallopeptidase, partial [Nannocystaceae bacterium]|nr:M56 family metallopeptidase [Nannocystaceae bacterium]
RAVGEPVVGEPVVDKPVVDKRIVEHRTGDLVITTVREQKTAAAVSLARGPLKASMWPWVIMGLVGAGSLFALGRLVLAARQLSKQLHGRRDVIEDPVLETHLALCAKAELKKRPRLSASSKLRSPVALWNNEICLPERAVDSLSQPQQQGMLAHELAHLIRRDPLWRVGIAAFEALFFFQPLNHLARRKLNEVAEFQCDDWAARNAGTGVHLAKCLAEVASWLDGGPEENAIATAMAAPSSPIVQRITRLLGNVKGQATGHPASRVAFTVFTLGAVVWFVPGISYAQPTSDSANMSTPVAASGEHGIRFEDASDGTFDRSTVVLDTEREQVRVHVEARRPAALQPVREAILPERSEEDRLQIVIRGGIWGGGFPFCMGACDGGMFLDLGWDARAHHRAARAAQRAERAAARAAERAYDAQRRAEAPPRRRGPHVRSKPSVRSRPSGWFELLSGKTETPSGELLRL